MTVKKDCDLIIIGGGPAGLTAAINAASEGLHVCIVDGAMSLGGQAKESRSIENYPLPTGYPDGVTGEQLMTGFIEQARKFNADMYCPVTAAGLHIDGEHRVVTMDDYQEFSSKTVLLANGLNYRRLDAINLGVLMGKGVYYGLPATLPKGKKVVVVGGANSAGQAVLKLAQSNKVTMVVRKHLDTQMSSYLVERIRASKNVYVRENSEIAEVCGHNRLEGFKYTTGDKIESADGLFIFIGAMPRTLWLKGAVDLDDNRFITTDATFETSMPGVFAAGDVRSGSTKRITAAIGEAVGALQSIHRKLGEVK